MPDRRDLLADVRRLRRSLPDVGPEHARSDGDFQRVSLPEADGDELRDLIVGEEARTVIEIGLAYGSSALAIAEALVSQGTSDAQHLVIDPYQSEFGNAGSDLIAAAGLDDLCKILTERSQLALPRLMADGMVADAAFVDGSHLFHNVFVDLSYLRELVRPGGLVVLDDCEWPSVATAVHYFEVNVGWRPEPIDRPTRLRAFRLPSLREEPDFRSFKPFGVDAVPGATDLS